MRLGTTMAVAVAACVLAAPAAQADNVHGGFSLQFGSPYPPPQQRYYQPAPVPAAPAYYGCRPVNSWGRDWHGRAVRVQSTQCFDAYGRPFTMAGSERVIGRPR